MRLKKPMIAISAAGLLALAACGGSGGGGGTPPNESATVSAGGNAGSIMDPNRQAPAAEAPGVQKGGTMQVNSYLGATTMDPTEAYYTNTAAILSDYVVRSLTQWVYDTKTKDMILVPDLATDLGTPNKD